jgi:branched-chain amino acid transport system permease protein
MNALEFYIVTLAVYACIDAIQALGFNLQFGYAGVVNMAYIVLVAVGAYFTGIAELPPASTALAGSGTYIGGFGWGFVPSVLFGIAVTVVFGAVLGLIVFRRLRHDYLALSLVALGQGMLVLVQDQTNLFNGAQGLGGVPGPSGFLVISAGDQFVFLGISLAALAVVYFVFRRLTASPWGRTLRAVRDNQDAVYGLGKDANRFKLVAFLFGAGAAGLTGALLVTYTGGWNPSSWQFTEVLITLAAVIVGGRARHAGAVLGALIVMVGVTSVPQYLPSIFPPGDLAAIEGIVLALLIILFVALWPQGILRERKENYRSMDDTAREVIAASRDGSVPLPARSVQPIVFAQGVAASTDGPTPVALSIRNLTCSFGGVQAVSDFSVDVPAGKLVGLIGPNGAGKSTLISCVSGFNRAYKGSVQLFAEDITRASPKSIAQLGMLRGFQAATVFEHMTALAGVAVAPQGQIGEKLRGVLTHNWTAQDAEIRREAATLLSSFELGPLASNYGGELSGGQRRLLELARLVFGRPRVLLLDEPFVGVSPANRQHLKGILRMLCVRDGITILMVEHRLDLVEEMCDLVLVMSNAKLISKGSMAEHKRNEEVVSAYLGRV